MLTNKTRSLLDSAPKKTKSEALVYDQTKGEREAGQLLGLLRKEKEIESDVGTLKAFLVDAVGKWHAKVCAERGHQPAVLVMTAEGTLQMLFQHRPTKIGPEKEAELRQEFGEDFDKFFAEQATVQFRKEIAGDAEQLNQVVRGLVKAIGPENFQAWFEAERSLVPTKEFTETIDAETRARFGVKQVVSISEKLEKAAA
jgi:hypothetical protein